MSADQADSGTTASVELLTAEVRTLVIGRRQVTMSVYKQLYWVRCADFEPFGRVAYGDASDICMVGRHKTAGTLVRANYKHPEAPYTWNQAERLPEAEKRFVLRLSMSNEDILVRLADEIDGNARISSRPRQLADLERIAGELRKQRDRIHSWAGLMALLDERYPPDIFTGVSGDPGPRMIVLIRELDSMRRAAIVLRDLVDLKDGPRDDRYRAEKDAAWDRARTLLAQIKGPSAS